MLALAAMLPLFAIAAAPLPLDVHRETLANGLRVVLAPDHTAPTVAVAVVYDVGARNEERGHAGFAHLFEHMMFQGSAHVPRGAHFQLVTSHGGILNGTTNSDRTLYFEMLPQNELALALWLEADRMKTLDVSQKNLDNQRAVVEEELRMRVENRPYAPAEIRLQEMVFQGDWPYEHSAFGSARDLDAAKLEWVRDFHDAYYAPNEAVLAIAGDFEIDAATALVHKYFDSAKAQPHPPKYDPPTMREQTQPREAVVVDAHAKLGALLFGWAIPEKRSKDHRALELAGLILGGGESSRLYRTLVREKALASDVGAGCGGNRGPDRFGIDVTLSATGTKTPGAAQKIVLDALHDLAKNGPLPAEMDKVRNQQAHAFLFGLQSNQARAQALAEYELFWGDATLLRTELARYLEVTADDVKRVVGRWLADNRRSQIDVKPAASDDGKEKASP